MKFHTHPLTTVALATVLGASFGLAACGDDDGGDSPAIQAPADDPEENGDEATTTTTLAGAQTPAPAGENTITLKLIAFKPTELDVAVGSKVTWIQDDVATHTVTSGTVEQGGGSFTATPDGTFDSGNIGQGQNFEHTFPQAGEFPFFCAVHPTTMTGVVRVK